MQSWLSSAAMQQDYVLFLLCVSWAGVGVLWWRFGRRLAGSEWLPWSVGAGLAAAGLEFYNFLHPVPAVPRVPPYLTADRIHGCITAVMLAGWLLSSSRRPAPGRILRRVAALFVVGVGVSRWIDAEPALGGLWLALTATACWAMRPGLPLGLNALAVWFSCHGPVAEWVAQPRRWTDVSEWGLLWNSVQLVAAVGALVPLLRQQWRTSGTEDERREWRPLLAACAIWLTAGLGLAAWMGRMARQNFEASVLSRVDLAATLMNHEIVAAAMGANFQLREVYERKRESGIVTRHGRVSVLAEPSGIALRRELGRIERANRGIKFISISTLRDGWVVDLTSTEQTSNRRFSDGVGISNFATADHLLAWSSKTSEYLAPHRTFRGLLTVARAPLLGDNGRMYGWLTFEVATAAWTASQGQARLLVFVIVALGIGLAVLVALQRRRLREREVARAAAISAAAADPLNTAFLAKVSHELRTPIQSILGYSELLRATLSDPTGRTRLAALRQHGELMLRLVNDLLDLSAIQAGAFRLNERPAAFAELLRQTVDSLRSRAEAKQLGLFCEIDPAIPEWARVDGERVRQIVLNLVGNAIKFTDAGWIEVTVAPATTGEEIRFTVRDTGPGIAPGERSRLFQPFSRLEATAAKEGTGLGLSLAAALCRSMQGALTVDNAPDGGACFVATFRAVPCAAQSVGNAIRSNALAGRKILVAEDNALVRELFVSFLREEGAICVAVSDGEAALAADSTQNFDAVVIDLGIPRLDGLETTRRLRAQMRPNLRIVGVSAHAGEQERTRALAAGMDVFLTKPVELSALADALETRSPGRATVVREEVRTRLVAQFRSEVAAQRAAIATALEEGDRGAVGAAAHYLKNSAAIVQDDDLFDACSALEKAASESDDHSLMTRWLDCQRALGPWLRRENFTGGESPVLPRNR